MVDSARDLLQSGESAVVIFTDGREFRHSHDGSGKTGFWKMNPKRSVDKVIIYRRDRSLDTNEVWTATPVGVIPAPARYPGRYIIKLSNVKFAGTTDEKWPTFAQTRQYPIRYLKKS